MRAIVMDCNGKNAVVLKEDGTFVTVKNVSYTIGQKIETAGMKRSGIGQLAAAACLCLMIGLGAAGAKLWLTPYSHVEVRAEYSVGLTLNRFQYVIDAEIESDENAVLPEEFEHEVKNKKASDAVADAIARSSDKDNAQVVVSSRTSKEQKKVEEQVAHTTGGKNANGKVVSQDAVKEDETSQVQASHNIVQAELASVGIEGEKTTLSEAETPGEEVDMNQSEEDMAVPDESGTDITSPEESETNITPPEDSEESEDKEELCEPEETGESFVVDVLEESESSDSQQEQIQE